ncbi:MAG: branched-chain amino acid ABC transporter permease LivH [Spirochaetes bacterium]|nr:branched-chain amino acid ABC transporter permease LivH [Spirochaetota bacterium]
MQLEYFISLLLGGLAKGSIYALIALGYTMVYGIIQLINFAHGEIYMIGAFTALIFSTVITYTMPDTAFLINVGISFTGAIIFAAAYGFTMERIAYRPLRNAPRLSALISAIGMSILLQNYVLLAQTPDFLPFPSLVPNFSFLEPIEYIVSSNQIVIIVTTIIVMILLTLLIKFTRVGKAMRATAQDKTMAQLIGINVDKIIAITFVIGSSTAALGGVLISSNIGQINYYIGFIAGIKAFVAAVLGGIGSIPGAVLGSLILGLTESFGSGYISSDYEDAFAFIFLVIILIFKPEGILGRKDNQKV